MTSILVVCTGNVCRSPMAEGLLRRALVDSLGADAPAVSSAGTAGWEGSAAMPEAIAAAAELDVDIAAHRAQLLRPGMAETADLVLCMAREHRDAIVRSAPGAAGRTFTLKELVRLLDRLPEGGPDRAGDRLEAADALRRGDGQRRGDDDDVVDPLGMPIDTYRAIADELDDLCARLVRAAFTEVASRPGGTET